MGKIPHFDGFWVVIPHMYTNKCKIWQREWTCSPSNICGLVRHFLGLGVDSHCLNLGLGLERRCLGHTTGVS